MKMSMIAGQRYLYKTKKGWWWRWGVTELGPFDTMEDACDAGTGYLSELTKNEPWANGRGEA